LDEVPSTSKAGTSEVDIEFGVRSARDYIDLLKTAASNHPETANVSVGLALSELNSNLELYLKYYGPEARAKNSGGMTALSPAQRSEFGFRLKVTNIYLQNLVRGTAVGSSAAIVDELKALNQGVAAPLLAVAGQNDTEHRRNMALGAANGADDSGWDPNLLLALHAISIAAEGIEGIVLLANPTAPVVSQAAGVVLIVHSTDQLQAFIRSGAEGRVVHTLTHDVVAQLAEAAGLEKPDAQATGVYVDTWLPLVVSLGHGPLAKALGKASTVKVGKATLAEIIPKAANAEVRSLQLGLKELELLNNPIIKPGIIRATLKAAVQLGKLTEKEAAEILAALQCFAAGTPLLTPTGHRFVEDFQVGDLILSRAEHDPDGPVEAKLVEAIMARTGQILHVHVGGQVIRTTAGHPFWVYNRGWYPAGQLGIGDLLVGHDGQVLPIEDLLNTGEFETVYNLRVADYHTYFVGCQQWGFAVWAHNADCFVVGETLGGGWFPIKNARTGEVIAKVQGQAKAIAEATRLTEKAADVAALIEDSNKTFPLTKANAEAALTPPPGATRTKVAGPNTAGADIKFYAADDSLILERELKSLDGGYNAFNRQLSKAVKSQLSGSGEVWMQVKPGTDIEAWLKSFRNTPGRNLGDYEGVTLRVLDDAGKVLYSGPIK
jgi:hypothetical protein